MTALRLVAVLALNACAVAGPLLPVPTPAREGQEVAAQIIWHDAYGREDAPPTIHWVEGTALNCTVNDKAGFQTPVGCREGWTMTPVTVSVAWRPDDFFSTTALAHEMQHAKQARRGILDPDHTRPEWQQGGEVEQANVRLQAQGM